MSLLFNFIGGAMVGCGLWALVMSEANFKTMVMLGMGCVVILLVDIKDRIKEQ
jgi:hypothetical protein